MLQMKIKAGRRSVVPGDLPTILGAQRAYREIGNMVEALIAQMDKLAGDCDLEDDDSDCCTAGDDGIFSGPVNRVGLICVDRYAGDDTDAERALQTPVWTGIDPSCWDTVA